MVNITEKNRPRALSNINNVFEQLNKFERRFCISCFFDGHYEKRTFFNGIDALLEVHDKNNIATIESLNNKALGTYYNKIVELAKKLRLSMPTIGEGTISQATWINNGDGTFTAKEGATLSHLQVATGRDWHTSDYKGDPENLQIGAIVSFAAKNEKNNYKTIDSTDEAWGSLLWEDW